MIIDHFHISVSNLQKAIDWMHQIFEITPVYNENQIAIFKFDNVTLYIDEDQDISCTIALTSSNCDDDYKLFLERGAISIHIPADMEWGVRTAHIKGPGLIKFEIDQKLSD